MSTPATETPVKGLTAAELAQALKMAGVGAQQQQAPQQQPLSDEELGKMLKRFKPDKTLLAALFSETANDDSRLHALHQIVAGAVTEAVTTSQHLYRHDLGQFQNDFQKNYGSHLAAAQELHTKAQFNDFYEANPSLKKHDKLVKMTLAELGNLPNPPQTREELFTLLAQRSAETVKGVDPTFSLEAPSATPTSGGHQSPSYPAPAALAGGGQGAGGPGAGASKQQPPSIWDDPVSE